MSWALLKVVISAVLISLASWLATRKPMLAGWIIALPVSTLLTLIFTHVQGGEARSYQSLARGIASGLPITYLFLLPFCFAESIALPFWVLMTAALAMLWGGFFGLTRLIGAA